MGAFDPFGSWGFRSTLPPEDEATAEALLTVAIAQAAGPTEDLRKAKLGGEKSCKCSVGEGCGYCTAEANCSHVLGAAKCSCTVDGMCRECGWCGCTFCGKEKPKGRCHGDCVGGDLAASAARPIYDDLRAARPIENVEARLTAVLAGSTIDRELAVRAIVAGLWKFATRDVAAGIQDGTSADRAEAWGPVLVEAARWEKVQAP